MLFAAAESAFAHASVSDGAVIAGLLHPVVGLDHLAAMLLVGVLSTLGQRSDIWGVPVTFILSMAAGGLFGWLDAGVGALVEPGIALSLLVFGLGCAVPSRLWYFHRVVVYVTVALFGLCHGYAHGAEVPAAAQPYSFAAGFLMATAALHLLGVVAGKILYTARFYWVLHAAGLAAVICGAGLLVSQ